MAETSKITRQDIISLMVKEGILRHHDTGAAFNLNITRDGYIGTVKSIIDVIEHYTDMLNDLQEKLDLINDNKVGFNEKYLNNVIRNYQGGN